MQQVIKPPKFTAAQAVKVRERNNHTREEAGAIIYRSARCWQDWELGRVAVEPAAFELYILKTGVKLK